MSGRPWNQNVIESVANDLEFVVEKLRYAANAMQDAGAKTLVLQADAAFGDYKDGLVALASKLEGEVRNQLGSIGRTPKWRKHRRTSLQRKAKNLAIEMRLIPDGSEGLTLNQLDAILRVSHSKHPSEKVARVLKEISDFGIEPDEATTAALADAEAKGTVKGVKKTTRKKGTR